MAATVREIGLAPWSAAATTERQVWVADLVERGGDPAAGVEWRSHADRILRIIKENLVGRAPHGGEATVKR